MFFEEKKAPAGTAKTRRAYISQGAFFEEQKKAPAGTAKHTAGFYCIIYNISSDDNGSKFYFDRLQIIEMKLYDLEQFMD